MPERLGAVRLLQDNDLNTALVGWRSARAGCGGLVNPKGWAILRVIAQKVVEGKLKDLYDQPIIIESPGAIVVCQAGDKVGLVQSFRFTGERILQAGIDYVKELDEGDRWSELLAALGVWQWELPRGLSPGDNSKDITKFIIASAKAEAIEETGFTIVDAKICGKVNANTTFFAHSQYVVYGRIVATGKNSPESLEIIGRTKLFSAREIREMVTRGELEDGLTLSALAIAGFHF